MIVNELNNKIGRAIYSKVITIEDDGDDTVIVFPHTNKFIAQIEKKRNIEKLYGILKNVRQ